LLHPISQPRRIRLIPLFCRANACPSESIRKHKLASIFQKLTMKPEAIDLLDRTGTNATRLLRRHQCGDFGDLRESDVRANRDAILTGARILSCYEVGTRQERVWVITESDRSASTLLLPGEY
jgi:hypothetical protein